MTTIDPNTPSSLPIHMARAYGLPARPVQPVGRIQGEAGRLVSADRTFDSFQLVQPGSSAGVSPSGTSRAENRLGAATVAGGVSFENGRPQTGLPMYTNPALRNAAATGVQLGRMIDARG